MQLKTWRLGIGSSLHTNIPGPVPDTDAIPALQHVEWRGTMSGNHARWSARGSLPDRGLWPAGSVVWSQQFQDLWNHWMLAPLAMPNLFQRLDVEDPLPGTRAKSGARPAGCLAKKRLNINYKGWGFGVEPLNARLLIGRAATIRVFKMAVNPGFGIWLERQVS